MGTQAVISVTKDGKTKLKLVTGMDGGNAPALAETLRSMGDECLGLSLRQIYDMAVSHGIGSTSLFVLDETSCYPEFDEDGEDLPESYRFTFQNPRINPRWLLGTADFIEVIEL